MTAIAKNSKLRRSLLYVKETMLDFPLYIISRPFKGFDEMKYLNRGSLVYAIAILVILGFVRTWQYMATGFVVTGFFMETPAVPVLWVMAFTYAPIFLICVANWSITSITDGKGKFKEIFLVYCYALFLDVIFRVLGTILSNYITVNEEAFVTFFFVGGQFLLYFYLFIGLVVIHEFTFFKAVIMVLLTVLAMLIIIFVLALFVSLVSEFLNFIFTIAYEVDAHVL